MIAAPTTDTTAQMTNRPGIPMAAAMTPPRVDPRIVASPDPLVRRPCAVPPVPAGARLARTVTPPTNTHANPTPSSGAIASSCHGSVARADRPVRSAKAIEPMTSSRSAPNRLASLGNAYMIGTSTSAPIAQMSPIWAPLPPIARHLDRVERVRAGQRGPHDDEPDQEQRHAMDGQDRRHAATQADRDARSAPGDRGGHDDREGQHRDVDPEERPRPELVEHDPDHERRDDERQGPERADLSEPVAGGRAEGLQRPGIQQRSDAGDADEEDERPDEDGEEAERQVQDDGAGRCDSGGERQRDTRSWESIRQPAPDGPEDQHDRGLDRDEDPDLVERQAQVSVEDGQERVGGAERSVEDEVGEEDPDAGDQHPSAIRAGRSPAVRCR